MREAIPDANNQSPRLDGDDGLSGEVLHQLDLVVCETLRRRPDVVNA